MNKEDKLKQRDHLFEQIEFYVSYIKTLQDKNMPEEMIASNKDILKDFKEELNKLRGL